MHKKGLASTSSISSLIPSFLPPPSSFHKNGGGSRGPGSIVREARREKLEPHHRCGPAPPETNFSESWKTLCFLESY